MKQILLATSAILATTGLTQAALVYTHDFTGGTDSWAMTGGGTMTTGDLTAAFTSGDVALSPLIDKVGGDTDAKSATLMAWVNLADATATNLFTVASRNSDDVTGYYGYKLSTDAAGTASVYQTKSSTSALATITSSTWVHVALTLTAGQFGDGGNTRNADVALYVNGQLWGGTPAPADAQVGTNFNGDDFVLMTFGQAGMSSGQVNVYDEVLDATAINAIYSAQAPSSVPEPSSAALIFGCAGLLAMGMRRHRKV